MITKLGKVVIHSKETKPTESFDILKTWSVNHVTNEKTLYLNFHEAIGTKPDRTVASDDDLRSTKSHDK